MKIIGLIVQCFVVMMLLVTAALCSKAESMIRVHMIDARSGMPITNRPVRLWMREVAEYRTHAGYLQEITDSNGVASFRVSDPEPTYLYVHTGMDGAWGECSLNSRTGYIAKEILESGVSKEGFCGKLPDISGKFHPNAGDIYIFVEHDTLFQRLRKPLD